MNLKDLDIKDELTIGGIILLAVLIIFSELQDKAILLGTAFGILGGVLKGAKKESAEGPSAKEREIPPS